MAKVVFGKGVNLPSLVSRDLAVNQQVKTQEVEPRSIAHNVLWVVQEL